MNNTITKAVIPCGGLGTRFLPITKAVAKEILPIIDKPCIDYIVDELVESGIEEILIILSPGKEIFKQYYSPSPKLYERLSSTGKQAETDKLKVLDTKAKISFVYQEEPKGSGDALLKAEKFCAGEPFALALGDDIMYNDGDPVTKQVINVFEKHNKAVLGVQFRELPEILRYGVIDKDEDLGSRTVSIKQILEKPKAEKLTSNLATLGRYVMTPEIFDYIRNTPIAKNGELQLTDSINLMARDGKVVAYDFIGRRYDMGDKQGSIEAQIEYGLRNPLLSEGLKEYLKQLMSKESF